MFSENNIQIIGSPASRITPMPAPVQVEVCRSFAYKLNLQNHGGLPYESADFFASRKMACEAESAAWVSQQIFEECVAEVRESIRLFIEEMRNKRERKTA